MMEYTDRLTKENLEAALPKIAAGSYVGTGSSVQTISLGFTPKAVFVCDKEGKAYLPTSSGTYFYGGLAVTGKPAMCAIHASSVVNIVNGGFEVRNWGYSNTQNYIRSNESETVYHYVAIG